MGSLDRKLKAFVRFDGQGRVVAGSLIFRKKMPKVGKWMEIPDYIPLLNPPKEPSNQHRSNPQDVPTDLYLRLPFIFQINRSPWNIFYPEAIDIESYQPF